MDIIDNVVPYVGGDEHKMETETLRMLGDMDGDKVRWLQADAGAACNRVPVIDGHLVNISVEFEQQPEAEAIIEAWEAFRASDEILALPSAPQQAVRYLPQQDRPQIRRDRNAGGGMTTSVGRLRGCNVLDYKFSALTHNTIRGAAGCSVLNAELMAVRGYIEGFSVEQRTAPVGE